MLSMLCPCRACCAHAVPHRTFKCRSLDGTPKKKAVSRSRESSCILNYFSSDGESDSPLHEAVSKQLALDKKPRDSTEPETEY